MSTQTWNVGDSVVHAERPEWGIGTVTAAQKALHEGKPCQRLTVRFQQGGLKTITTGIADLRLPEVKLLQPRENAPDDNWLAAAERPDPAEVMGQLPEAATDPFRPALQRLQSTLSLYRFTGQGASLIEWATAQSGLPDPLAVMNRHELEEHFARFRINLDNHARKLILDLKRSDPAGLAAAMAKAPPEAQRSVRRLNIDR